MTHDSALPLLIIYTGGTIGMVASTQGFVPSNDFEPALRSALETACANNDVKLPEFNYQALGQAIDSANLIPLHWQQIASAVIENYQDYSGFVILHGTDTMAYTASALSFMLQGLTKPIVLTGSQIPLALDGSDGPKNLVNALVAAQLMQLSPQTCEVTIAFDNVLLRGCRASKVSSLAMAAFNTPSCPPLAYFNELASLSLNSEKQPEPLSNTLRLAAPEFEDESVCVIHMAPGMSNTLIDAALNQSDLKAIILLSYGTGNLPTERRAFCRALASCLDKEIVVVNVSQCHDGWVDQGTYASGNKLNDYSVISAVDMTVEAAYTKLHYLISLGSSAKEIREGFNNNLANEQG